MLNLLVVMIDCLRQDRFEGQHKTALTPNLDAFLKRSTAFDNIHAVGSNTTAVMGSWFTGLYPFHHGLRSFRDRRFLGKPRTMARLMRESGYRTVATTTEAMADAEDLLDGFDEIERRDKKKEAIHNGYGARVVDKLDELNESTQPWFYFVHTCELHPDRQCDPRFQNHHYGRDFYDRCLSSVDYYLGPIFDAVDWDNTVVVVFGDHGDNLIWEPRGEFASRVMNRLRADGRVSLLWHVRDAFYRAGLYSRWKGILRSNALFHHDYHVYRFLTHSPLMMTAPGLPAGQRIKIPMSSVDMMPTLLDYLGLPKATGIDGFDFGPLLRGEAMETPSRALYQEVVTDFVLKGRDPSKLRIPLLHALIQDGWKYVESMLDRRIQPELYNLAQDPLERHNLYSACRDSALVKRFVEELRTIEDQHAVAATSLNPDGSVLASA
jgi:arylsulfatase A-like enzyme